MRRRSGGGSGAVFSSPARFPLRSIPVGARERIPAGQGRWERWNRGAGPALVPRSRRPRGRGELGRRAAVAAAPPSGCWTGTAGCCAMASSTWRSTRRYPSPSSARGPAPASRAAVSTPPASATRAGWGTSASTARAGSSKCLRRTPNLSPAPHPSRPPPFSRPRVPRLGVTRSAAGAGPALSPSSPRASGTSGPASRTDRRGCEAFPDGPPVRSDSGPLIVKIFTLSYGAKHHFC